MLTPPADLDPALLLATLADGWDLDPTAHRLDYLPVGFGSHHWRATAPGGRALFVTADDHRSPRRGTHVAPDAAGLDAALRAVVVLRDRAGLAFAHAPVPDRGGRAAVPVGDTGWTLSVYEGLDARPLADHGPVPASERDEVLALLARLHAVSPEVVPGLRPVDLSIGYRPELEAALAVVDRPWGPGPYAEPARELVAAQAGAIRTALAANDRREVALVADRSGWVVTHGEPHGGNVLRDRAGGLHVVDWDTLALGPPERDLWHLAGGDGQAGPYGAGPDGRGHSAGDWSAYLSAGGRRPPSRSVMRAFRQWWSLGDLAEFVAWLRAPHADTPELRVAWEAVRETLPLGPEFLAPW